jgi:glycine/serine hydroxymethyltransferase
MSDYLFRGNLAKLDRDVFDLTQFEAERQARKLILIPSESTAPMAVREALSSGTFMRKATPKKRRAGCPKKKFWIIQRV